MQWHRDFLEIYAILSGFPKIIFMSIHACGAVRQVLDLPWVLIVLVPVPSLAGSVALRS